MRRRGYSTVPRRRLEVGPGAVHLGLWRMASAERRWALAAPYDPKLVAGLKRIPGGARAWLPDAKVWVFEREYLDSIRGLCGQLYWTETLCPTCWSGASCAALAELAGVAGATHLPSRPPEPSPPWRPTIPKTVPEAAAILGVAEDAGAPVIRKRARQLAFEVHPDHHGDEERMVVILAARDLLLAQGVQRG
jgi:hypothetical protein